METIDIGKLNVADRAFCISYPLEDDLLLDSIRKFGVLTPLGLLADEHPIIVTGHRRAEAARRLGIGKVPAFFIDGSETRALLTSINDNLGRPLNTVEKALCVERMASLGFSAADTGDVMAMLGLPSRQNVIATCMSIASAEDRVKSFIAKNRLSIPAVEQLFAFDEDERTRILGLAASRQFTFSSFREMLQLTMLLKVKRGAVDFDDLAQCKDMEAIRLRLKRQTHPLLSTLEVRLGRLLSACALPPHIRIGVDPAFERESIEIIIRAKNDGDVEGALTKLANVAKQGLFGSIFELTHGTPDRF